jgi:hypothetical protein
MDRFAIRRTKAALGAPGLLNLMDRFAIRRTKAALGAPGLLNS